MLYKLVFFLLLLPFIWVIILLLVSFSCLFIHWNLRERQSKIKLNWITWLNCFVCELINITQVYYLRIIYRLGYRPKEQYKRTDKVPVVLLHGYTDTPFVWYWFKRKLRKQYKGPVYAIALKPALASIETIAEQLHHDLLNLFQLTRAKKIHIVGHSMGGLVACYWIHKYQTHAQVISLFTLGTPWQGTKMSFFALGKNGKQMKYKSDFAKSLLQKTMTGVDLVSVVSLCDNIVVPWQSAMAHTQAEQNIVKNGHVSLTFSREVFHIVLQKLLFSQKKDTFNKKPVNYRHGGTSLTDKR